MDVISTCAAGCKTVSDGCCFSIKSFLRQVWQLLADNDWYKAQRLYGMHTEAKSTWSLAIIWPFVFVLHIHYDVLLLAIINFDWLYTDQKQQHVRKSVCGLHLCEYWQNHGCCRDRLALLQSMPCKHLQNADHWCCCHVLYCTEFGHAQSRILATAAFCHGHEQEVQFAWQQDITWVDLSWAGLATCRLHPILSLAVHCVKLWGHKQADAVDWPWCQSEQWIVEKEQLYCIGSKCYRAMLWYQQNDTGSMLTSIYACFPIPALPKLE